MGISNSLGVVTFNNGPTNDNLKDITFSSKIKNPIDPSTNTTIKEYALGSSGLQTNTQYSVSTDSGIDTSGISAGMPTPIFTKQTLPVSNPVPVNQQTTANPTVPKDSEYNGYKHFADEIGETANLHWFTEDERELLIAIYNRLKNGITIDISPESRHLCWTVQPGSFAGMQNLPIICPYDGTLLGMTAASVGWGPEDITIVLQKDASSDFNTGAPTFQPVSPFIITHSAKSTLTRAEFVSATDAVACAKDEIYDLKFLTTPAMLASTLPINVQLWIKLKDSSTTAKIDLGVSFDPSKYLPNTATVNNPTV